MPWYLLCGFTGKFTETSPNFTKEFPNFPWGLAFHKAVLQGFEKAITTIVTKVIEPHASTLSANMICLKETWDLVGSCKMASKVVSFLALLPKFGGKSKEGASLIRSNAFPNFHSNGSLLKFLDGAKEPQKWRQWMGENQPLPTNEPG